VPVVQNQFGPMNQINQINPLNPLFQFGGIPMVNPMLPYPQMRSQVPNIATQPVQNARNINNPVPGRNLQCQNNVEMESFHEQGRNKPNTQNDEMRNSQTISHL